MQVPVGVITKNEIVHEELAQIIEELQKKYTPMQGIHIHKGYMYTSILKIWLYGGIVSSV